MRKKAITIFVLIILVSLFAGFFIYPKNWGASTRAWKLGLDLVGGSRLTYEIDMSGVKSGDQESVASGLRDVIEKRVNLFGVAEPQVYSAKSGDSYRLSVELAGIKDISEAIKQIGETPYLFFAEGKESKKGTTTETKFVPTGLDGRYIVNASMGFSNTGLSGPEILLNFNDEGAKLFEEITGRNIGKPVGVFLDGNLITAPTVQGKISGGKAQITGNFSQKEAKEMVSRFNAGALPAPIKLVSQSTVGASIGSDSLRQTLLAGLVGMILVIFLMLVYYGLNGLAATIALIIYTILAGAIFKLFGITMTLSGIAGFILSIGMAVDANILIFERTKEESKKGLDKTTSLEEGFKRAWLSIRDSNISTIITALILYYSTTGFIKGFSLTLLIGVLISMFSAITVTRAILRSFISNKAKQ